MIKDVRKPLINFILYTFMTNLYETFCLITDVLLSVEDCSSVWKFKKDTSICDGEDNEIYTRTPTTRSMAQ